MERKGIRMEKRKEASLLVGICSCINPERNIGTAIRLIRRKFSVDRFSLIYRANPGASESHTNFLCCALHIRAQLEPMDCFNIMNEIEQLLKREKKGKLLPGEMEIDILFYGAEKLKTGRLVIPYPEA